MSHIAIIITTLLLCVTTVLANTALSSWTWISGFSEGDQRGVYGVQGVPSADNYPGGRYRKARWYDSVREELWVFGGTGYGSSDYGGAWSNG